jgi:hypothetical protein
MHPPTPVGGLSLDELQDSASSIPALTHFPSVRLINHPGPQCVTRCWRPAAFLLAAALLAAVGQHQWDTIVMSGPADASLAAFAFAGGLLGFGVWATADGVLDLVCELSDVPMGNWYAQLPQRYVLLAGAPQAVMIACDVFGGGPRDFPPSWSAALLAVSVIVGGIAAQRAALTETFSVEPARVDGVVKASASRFVAATAGVALAFAALPLALYLDAHDRAATHHVTVRGALSNAVRIVTIPLAAFAQQLALFEARTSPDIFPITSAEFPNPIHREWVRGLGHVKFFVSYLRQQAAWTALLSAVVLLAEPLPGLSPRGSDSSFSASWHHLGDRLVETVGAVLATSIASLLVLHVVTTNVARGLLPEVLSASLLYALHGFWPVQKRRKWPEYDLYGFDPDTRYAAGASVVVAVGTVAAVFGYTAYLDARCYRLAGPLQAVLVRSSSRYELFDELPMEPRHAFPVSFK